MYNPMALSGANILVTGASSGIGRGICVTCHRLGANVIPVARNGEALYVLADELGVDKNRCYSFDLKNISGIQQLIESVVAKHGRLNGLVHSAGVGLHQNINAYTYEQAHDVFMINFFAFIELVKFFAKNKNNGSNVRPSSIVGISSTASVKGYQGSAIYAGSKGAMNSAIKALATEFIKKNIRINAVLPGIVKTKIYDVLEVKLGREALAFDTQSKQPLGVGYVDDIANMVAYLLSDAARFITGNNYLVDGGAIL